jgi:peroxiredoxin
MPTQKMVHHAAPRPASHKPTVHQKKPLSASSPSQTPRSPTRSQRLKSTPPLPSHRRHRHRTIGQWLASTSGGGWAGILTGVLVLGIGIFALVTSLRSTASTGIAQLNPTHGLLAVGTEAPGIGPLPAADGNSYTLTQFRGSVVVLEFFATWCPNCQAETSVLNQIQHNNADRGVQVLSVTASDDGRHSESMLQPTPLSMADVQWYVSTYHLTYPALLDTSLQAGNAYGVQGYPTIYIINQQGVITYAGEGQIPYDSLQQHIKEAQSSQ